MIREEPFDKRLLESGHVRNSLVRKMKSLEEMFPEEIDGIFIIPTSDLPDKFSKKTNILVSFKHLSLLNYFRFVIDRDVCLMDIWKSGASDFQHRANFWSTKNTRMLLALGRIHFQSDIISIWVWADTRMVSIEFFCKAPVTMTQAFPNKVLRIV